MQSDRYGRRQSVDNIDKWGAKKRKKEDLVSLRESVVQIMKSTWSVTTAVVECEVCVCVVEMTLNVRRQLAFACRGKSKVCCLR